MLDRFSWEDIHRQGERLGIPPDKKRALIREYIQTRIIRYLYEKRDARHLSFIGGTGLRILRGIDRFSEDLDFDNLGLSYSEIRNIFAEVAANLTAEGFKIEFTFKKIDGAGTGSFKFLSLLFDLDISRHKDEKLMIKLDYTTPKTKPNTEVVILNRFGLTQSVVTSPEPTLLAQKIRALFQRKEILARDIYDIVWLFSRSNAPDFRILKDVGIRNEKELYIKFEEIYESKIRPRLGVLKRKLAPFLIHPQNVRYLDFFGDLIKQNKERAFREK